MLFLTLLMGTMLPCVVKSQSQASFADGIHVSEANKKTLSWEFLKGGGYSFTFIDLTKGTRPTKAQNYDDQSTGAKMAKYIIGALHIGRANESTGEKQALHFISNGGGWTNEGNTLPGAISLQGSCYGLTSEAMVKWIREFASVYNSKAQRPPVIFTSTEWWKKCTGNDATFGSSPLCIMKVGNDIGPLPASWTKYTFWEKDPNVKSSLSYMKFNGKKTALKDFAKGTAPQN